MPQIDFTVFFIFALWIFPLFFAVFFYSLVYVQPVLVLWNKVVLHLSDFALLRVFVFVKFNALFSTIKYLSRIN